VTADIVEAYKVIRKLRAVVSSRLHEDLWIASSVSGPDGEYLTIGASGSAHKILAMLRERHLDAELATGRGQIRVYLQRPTSTL
jgi:hypothetical protein